MTNHLPTVTPAQYPQISNNPPSGRCRLAPRHEPGPAPLPWRGPHTYPGPGAAQRKADARGQPHLPEDPMHDDECDKAMYGPEGICTCDPALYSADRDEEPSASAMLAMEDYTGPALDW